MHSLAHDTFSIRVPFLVCCGVIMMSINKQFGIADLLLNLGTQSDIVYALLFLDTSRTIQNNSIQGCTLDPLEDSWIAGTTSYSCLWRDNSTVVFRLPIVYSSLSFDDPGDRSTEVQMTSSYHTLLLRLH